MDLPTVAGRLICKTALSCSQGNIKIHGNTLRGLGNRSVAQDFLAGWKLKLRFRYPKLLSLAKTVPPALHV